MDSRRIRNLRNSFDKNIVDKQVDKIFETGRQFVDGVSGARPGKRRNSDFQGITSKSVKKVGRWVSEKVDLFFDEDNDDWNDDNFYPDNTDIKTFIREVFNPYLENLLGYSGIKEFKKLYSSSS